MVETKTLKASNPITQGDFIQPGRAKAECVQEEDGGGGHGDTRGLECCYPDPLYPARSKKSWRQMGGRNKGICHSCRDPGHWFDDCPNKKRCPRCGVGFVRLLEVEKIGDSKGKLFLSCTRFNCRYFDWKKDESTLGTEIETKTVADVDELEKLMRNCGRVANEDDVDVNLITFRKRKGSGGKGKEKMED